MISLIPIQVELCMILPYNFYFLPQIGIPKSKQVMNYIDIRSARDWNLPVILMVMMMGRAH